jgi:hypothetical protein
MKLFSLLCFLIPTWVIAGYGGMGGVSEGGEAAGTSDAASQFLFWSIFAGVVVGYFYSIHYNDTHEEKIAADGCMIIGGFAGPFVCGLLWIVFK